jgi:hypothetical protein
MRPAALPSFRKGAAKWGQTAYTAMIATVIATISRLQNNGPSNRDFFSRRALSQGSIQKPE